MEALMVIRAGTQCHGFMWKKSLPRKLEVKRMDSSFFLFENSGCLIRSQAYTEIVLNNIRQTVIVTFLFINNIYCNIYSKSLKGSSRELTLSTGIFQKYKCTLRSNTHVRSRLALNAHFFGDPSRQLINKVAILSQYDFFSVQ